MTEALMDKPLPTLAEWLGDAPKCDGYYDYVAQNIDLQRVADAADQPDAAAALRMTMTLGIAIAETCRIETNTHGRDVVGTVLSMARCAGWAMAGPVMSILKDDAPLDEMEKILKREMLHGLRMFMESAKEMQAEHLAKKANTQ